jgi:SUMO ligase MMS21 Smc5/6 complex component
MGRTVPHSKYAPQPDLHPIVGTKAHLKERDARILCEQRYGTAVCHFMGDEKEEVSSQEFVGP